MAQQNVAQSASTSLQSSAVDALRNSRAGGLAPHLQTQAHHQSLGNHRLSSALPTENPLASPQVMPLEVAFAAATQTNQTTLAQSLQNRAPSWLKQGLQGMQQWLGPGRETPVSPLPQTQGPLIGIIDTGFAPGQHGHQMLQTIQSGNPEATILVADSVGKGTWADSLTQFVDTAKATGQTRAVVNASFDLTQKNPDGSITTRKELTAQEKAALNYARENGVLIVASAGNEAGAMSALGQASGLSDNLIVVGSAEGNDRAAYSSFGKGLDFLFAGNLDRSAGTSTSAAKTTQTIAQIWAANPNLTPQQVVQTLEATALDLQKPGWDATSGLGIVNPEAALHYAATVTPAPQWMAEMGFTQPASDFGTPTWNGNGGAVATERANLNLRGVAAAVRNTLRPSSRPRPRGSGVANAVRRAAAIALRNTPRPSPRPRPRGTGVANTVRRAAAIALRNTPQPSPRPRPRGTGLSNAVRQAAAVTLRNTPRPSPRPRPRDTGLSNAIAGGATALHGYLQRPGRPSPRSALLTGALTGGAMALGRRLPLPGSQLPRGPQLAGAIAGGAFALGRRLPLPGGRAPRGSGLAGAIAGGGATALRRHLQLPGRPNLRGSGLAGAIAGGGATALRRYLQQPGRPRPGGSLLAGALTGGAVALGRRLPLPGIQLPSGSRTRDAIAGAQQAIRRIRPPSSSPSSLRGFFSSSLNPSGLPQRLPSAAGGGSFNLPRLRASHTTQSIPGITVFTGLTPPSQIVGNPLNLLRDEEFNEATDKVFDFRTPWGERVEAFNTASDKVAEHLGPTGKALDFSVDLGVGFAEGGASTVTDLWDSAKGTWNAVRNPEQAINDLRATVQAIREDHRGVAREMWNSFTQPYVEDWRNGQYGQAIGRGVFEGVTILVPGGAATRAVRPLARLMSHRPSTPGSPGRAPNPGQRTPDPETPRGPAGRGPDAPNPPGGTPNPGGAAPEPRPTPPPSTGGNGRGPGLGSSPGSSEPPAPSGSPVNPPRPQRPPTRGPNPGGGTPGPETPGGPSGRGPDAPNPSGDTPNPGGAAPESRPALPPPTGSNGRGPGSSPSPGDREPPTPAGSPVNPPQPRPSQPSQNPPPTAGRHSPTLVDPSRRANPGGGGPRTPLHRRPPSGRDSNDVPVLVGDRSPSGPQRNVPPTPGGSASGSPPQTNPSGNGTNPQPQLNSPAGNSPSNPPAPPAPQIGAPVPGLRNARYGRPRGGGGRPQDVTYAEDVADRLAVYVDGPAVRTPVEFDGVRGRGGASGYTLLDAKNGSQMGFYDVTGTDRFTRNFKIPEILKQARRQLSVLPGSGASGIEWRVPDERVALGLQRLFEDHGLDITVVHGRLGLDELRSLPFASTDLPSRRMLPPPPTRGELPSPPTRQQLPPPPRRPIAPPPPPGPLGQLLPPRHVWDRIDPLEDRTVNIARPKISIPIAIPRLFNIQVGNQRLHVHPHATKHFREELNHAFFAGGLIQQQQLLESFHGALKLALDSPNLNRLGRNEGFTAGDWEFGIDFSNQGSGRLPVVFHARPILRKNYPPKVGD